MPGQHEKVKRVYASIRLHEFQTKEPTSSLAHEKVPDRSPREDPHMIDKQSDKSRPVGMPDVNDSRSRHVDAVESQYSKFRLRGIYIRPRHNEVQEIGLECPARGSGEYVNTISKPFGVEFEDPATIHNACDGFRLGFRSLDSEVWIQHLPIKKFVAVRPGHGCSPLR